MPRLPISQLRRPRLKSAGATDDTVLEMPLVQTEEAGALEAALPPGPKPRPRRRPLAGAAPFLPAGLVVGAWIVLAQIKGGYFPRDWYPVAIGAVVLAAVVAVARERALPRPAAARAALLLLAALVLWSFLSLLWAESPGNGLHAANKLLFYLAAAWVLALLPWTTRSASGLLGLWSLGIGAVCVASLIGATRADELSDYLLEWRYQHPIGYSNATAGLAVMAVWPALALAVRRGTPVLLQGLFVAAAAFLLEFSLLAQSRGAVLGLALAALAFLVLMPDRLRVLPRMAIVAGAVAWSAPRVLEVYDAGAAGHRVGPVLDAAASRMATAAALAAVVAVGLGLVERLVRPNDLAARRLRLGMAALWAVLALSGLGLVAVNGGRIADRVEEEWEVLEEGGSGDEGSRLSSLANTQERPDYFRVSRKLIAEHPLAGVGAGNFEWHYTARRTQPKHSRYAHDIWLRVLVDTGLVGGALLVGFLLAAFAGATRGIRRLGHPGRAIVAACLAVTAYFLVHASVDWLDEVPALAAPAFGLPFVALAVARGSSSRAPRASRPRRLGRWAGVAVGAVAVAAALVALVPAYLSVRYVERAFSRAQAEPDAAFKDLDRAARLSPFSIAPRVSEGTIAVQLGRRRRARAAFERALEVERNWYSHLELALLDAYEGRAASARRRLERAGSLSARDPLVASVRRRLRRGERIDPAAFNRMIGQRTRADFTTRQR